MLSRLAKRHQAFTLLESVIVLTLLGTMLLIGIYRFPSRQRQLTDEKMFWERFSTVWNQSVFLSSSQRQAYFIQFEQYERQIVVDHVDKVSGERRSVIIPFPETLKLDVTGNKSLVVIYPSGHTTVTTIKFTSQISGKTSLSFQFGWGAYRVKKN